MMESSYVKAGVLGSAGSESNGQPLADVATINEYGSPERNIPSRPFMRQTFDASVNLVVDFIARQMDAIFQGRSDVRSSLTKMGIWYVGEIKKMFTRGDFAPNAPSTIRLKGSSKPLIDTGRLRQSINHEVIINGPPPPKEGVVG